MEIPLLVDKTTSSSDVLVDALAIFSIQVKSIEWRKAGFLRTLAETLRSTNEDFLLVDLALLDNSYRNALRAQVKNSGIRLLEVGEDGARPQTFLSDLAKAIQGHSQFQATRKYTTMTSATDFKTDCHDTGSELLNLVLKEPASGGFREALVVVGNFQVRHKDLLASAEGQAAKSFLDNLCGQLNGLAAAGDQTEVDSREGLRTVLLRLKRQQWAQRGSNGQTRPRRKPSDVPDSSQRIPTTVLIIEDDTEYAEELAANLRARCDDGGAGRFALEFLLHTPGPKETLSQYRQRLLTRLSCDDPHDALPSLQIAIVDRDLALLPSGEGSLSGIDLARDIRRMRPGVALVLATGTDIVSCVEDQPEADLFAWTTSKHDPASIEWQELFALLLRDLEQKYSAPFWNALRSFADRPVQTFHAMAFARGRSGKRSHVLHDFIDFYGPQYFNAETSATVDPLDSLLYPTGSLAQAMDRAKIAFGSQQTLFVTNGTSTANKIVLQALLRPGDYILVDRNCHISHHYAIVLAGARPVYLEPEQLPLYGISTSIRLETIRQDIGSLIDVGRFPRAILLTNCTFDGIIVNPESVIEAVYDVLLNRGMVERLGELAFVFDEAWFAFARFHPKFVASTGMAAAASLCKGPKGTFYRDHLRVYVTQSTHKTLSSFRQGSMIHVFDPVLNSDPESQLRLTEAFLTHTTTSPHSGILASLDVARRQAELEGCALVTEALRLAGRFRADIYGTNKDSLSELHEVYALLSAEELIPADLRDQWQLDLTKVTLHIKKGPSGDAAKKVLLREHDIQVNKTSSNTILLMFNAGTTESALANLVRVLKQTASSWRGYPEQVPRTLSVPRFSRFGFADADLASAELDRDMAFYFFNRPRWPVDIVPLSSLHAALKEDELLAATFITPYPPGYPILVPGQAIDAEYAELLIGLNEREIHGCLLRAGVKAVPVYKRTSVAKSRH